MGPACTSLTCTVPRSSQRGCITGEVQGRGVGKGVVAPWRDTVPCDSLHSRVHKTTPRSPSIVTRVSCSPLPMTTTCACGTCAAHAFQSPSFPLHTRKRSTASTGVHGSLTSSSHARRTAQLACGAYRMGELVLAWALVLVQRQQIHQLVAHLAAVSWHLRLLCTAASPCGEPGLHRSRAVL